MDPTATLASLPRLPSVLHVCPASCYQLLKHAMPVALTVPPVNKQTSITASLATQATTFLVSPVRLVHQTAFDATHLPAFVDTAAQTTALCLTVVASTSMDMEYTDL